MSMTRAPQRQPRIVRLGDALWRSRRATLAWIWTYKWWFITIDVLLGLVALATVALSVVTLKLRTVPWVISASAFGVLFVVLVWARIIYRSQYGGRYKRDLAPYVVQRVSELKKLDYVPAYAGEVIRDHPTARLVRHALRTAERSSLSRARVLSVAPLPVGVCIFGEPLQDKTSLAWEAMRQVLPGWTFVKWPHLKDINDDIVKRCGKRVVLWLDDLHEYGNRLESVTLDDVIDRFANARVQVVVVATCRWHEDEREARAHLGYLLDHLLPIRLATKPGDRSEDPVVLQITMDQPTTPPSQTLAKDIEQKREVYKALIKAGDAQNGQRAVLRAMALLRSAGILVYTQERVRAIAAEFGLGAKDADFKKALLALVDSKFIRPMPELKPNKWLKRNLLKLWNWMRGVQRVTNADVRPISEWYLDRVVSPEERDAEEPGTALGEIWTALRPTKDTAALILLGDAYLDPRRPYLRNSGAQAIQCYDAAREALDAAKQPLQMAAALIGLGNACLVEAARISRNNRSEQLKRAYNAYREAAALSGLPPVLLGEALAGVGNTKRAMAVDARQANDKGGAVVALNESGASFKEAIESFKQAHSPFQWATAHYELANVSSEQAELESKLGNTNESLQMLRLAEGSHRLAREVYTRTTAPTDWAKIQQDLGASLLSLSRQLPAADPATAKLRLAVLQEAVDALRAALGAFRQFRMDGDWAAVGVTLGNALKAETDAIDAVKGTTSRQQDTLTQAVDAFRTAQLYYKPERAPLDWGDVQIALGRTYRQQGDIATVDPGASDTYISPTTYLRQARDCVQEAIDDLYTAPFGPPFKKADVEPEMQERRAGAVKLLKEIKDLLQEQ
jgi:tetratricopeptide (TPR) repeat protein